jgi:hypothetical protein
MAVLPKPAPVEGNLGEFGYQTSNFSIAVNGKAFKILIDKLYTDKIGSIERELATNAYDSHIAAGCPERPFDVILPTVFNPVFTIRDYGTSISHDDCMSMYVTVFESTKEDTNEQVGAWGLGSKSPFAYTDSFSVKAWQDGYERTYVVGYGSDGIPSITHISTVESDEERGLQVSFPVQPHDCSAFRDAAARIFRWFTPQPNVEGLFFAKAEPSLANDNWALFEGKSHSMARLNVRQGCVVYPVHNASGLNTDNILHGNWQTYYVVDVPIGSVSVTASREALSLDPETIEFLKAECTRINQDVNRVLKEQFQNAPTYYEAMKLYSSCAHLLKGFAPSEYSRPGMEKSLKINSGYFTLPRDDPKMPVAIPQNPSWWHANKSGWPVSFSVMKNLTFIVDRDQKMLRKKLRVREYVKENNCKNETFILLNPTGKQLARLIRRFQLRPDQIVSITTLPDVVPATGPAKGATTQSGIKKSGIYEGSWGKSGELTKIDNDDTVDGDFYWLPIAKPTDPTLNSPACKPLHHLSPKTLWKAQGWAGFIGLPQHRVFFLTENAVKRIKPDVSKRLDTVMHGAFNEAVKEKAKKAYADRALVHGIPRTLHDLLLTEETRRNAASVTYIPSNSPFYLHYMSGIGYDNMAASAEIAKYAKKYPLLFSTSNNPEAVKEYVEFCNNKEKDHK